MSISPSLAFFLTAFLALLAAKRAFVAVLEQRVTWGSYKALTVDRRKNPAAFWFSVGILVFLFLSLATVSLHMAQAALAGA